MEFLWLGQFGRPVMMFPTSGGGFKENDDFHLTDSLADKVDRGEIEGQSTDQALELAAARQRIRQLETELAVSRKVNEVFLTQPVSTSSAVRDSTPALHREAACLSL